MYNIIAFIFFSGVAAFSVTHALGLWLIILLIHGMLVMFMGDIAIHFPLYCGLATGMVVLVKGQWKAVPKSFLVAVFLFVTILTAASVTGLDLSHSTIVMLNYFKAILLALLLAGCLVSESDIKTITIYCLVGLVIGSLFSLYQYITGQYVIQNIYIQRAAGLRTDPNDTAMLLVTGIPLGLYWLFNTKKNITKLLCVGVILLILFSIMLTGSRGGFVTLLIIGLGFYIRKPTIGATVLGGLLIVFMIALAPKTFVDRIETLVTGQEKHGGKSMNNRLELQMTGIKLFLDNPVIGVGPGNFGLAYIQDKKPGYTPSKGSDFSHSYGVAHNMHLEMFVETGLFGGLLFELIMLLAFKGFLGYDKHNKTKQKSYTLGYMLALSLIGLLFSGLFLSQGKNSVLWFIVGMGFAMKKLTDQQRVAKRRAQRI